MVIHPIPLALVIALSLGGCGHAVNRQGDSAPQTQDNRCRYDDVRFSPDERHAVHVATEAMRIADEPRHDFDQIYRYSVSMIEGEWHVTLWHVMGFEDGSPQFAPGGYTDVILDKHFQVKQKLGGE